MRVEDLEAVTMDNAFLCLTTPCIVTVVSKGRTAPIFIAEELAQQGKEVMLNF
jgi:hypothetical protein